MNYNRKVKTDANQGEIVEFLEAHGVEVIPTQGIGAGFPDLVICKTITCLLEIKVLSDAKFTIQQLKFIAGLKTIPVAIVKTKEAALKFAVDPIGTGLTAAQKFKIRQWLDGNERKQSWIMCTQFENEIFKL